MTTLQFYFFQGGFLILYFANTPTPTIHHQRIGEGMRPKGSQAGMQKVFALAKMMTLKDIKVQILSPSITYNRKRPWYPSLQENISFTNGNFPLLHLPAISLPLLNYLFICLYLSWYCFKNRKKYQKIIFYNYRPEFAIPALLAHHLLAKKILLECEDGLDRDARSFISKKLLQYLKRKCDKHAQGIMIVNKSLANEFTNTNLWHCPGVMDWDQLQNRAKKKQASPSQSYDLAYTGILSDHYGLHELIQLMKKTKFLNFKLHITGHYWQNSVDLKEFIEQEGLQEHCNFYGMLPQSDFVNLLQKMNGFLLLNFSDSTYYKTNSPSKVFQYLPYGKPIYTSLPKDFLMDFGVPLTFFRGLDVLLNDNQDLHSDHQFLPALSQDALYDFYLKQSNELIQLLGH